MIESYKDLNVWQRAIELSLAVYAITNAFPKEEIFGLSTQMRRASVSIASHIAEGYGRGDATEYRRALGISRGANLELQTHMVIASRLGLLTPDQNAELESLSVEVSKMLNSLMPKLSA